jgi:hypothetical protein
LELHSIGKEDYDGLLVEYHTADKEARKCVVTPAMKVQPKCCKRPEVKPYKLRRTLADLAFNFMKSKTDPLGTAAAEKKFLGLLEKDPVCLPALAGLFLHEQEWIKVLSARTASPSPSELEPHFEKTIIFLYRLVANQYAYPNYVSESQHQIYRRQLSSCLDAIGHSKTAVKELKKYNLGKHKIKADYAMPQDIDRFTQATILGESHMDKAKKMHQEHRISEDFTQRMKAVDHYMASLKIAVNMSDEVEGAFPTNKRGMVFFANSLKQAGENDLDGFIGQSLRKIDVTLNRFRDFLKVKIAFLFHPDMEFECPGEYGGDSFDVDMGLRVSNYIIDIVDRVLAACKKEEGSTVLTESQTNKYVFEKKLAKDAKGILKKERGKVLSNS